MFEQWLFLLWETLFCNATWGDHGMAMFFSHIPGLLPQWLGKARATEVMVTLACSKGSLASGSTWQESRAHSRLFGPIEVAEDFFVMKGVTAI